MEPDASNFTVKIIRIYMGVNTETGAVSELKEPLSIKGTFCTCTFEWKKKKLTNTGETKRINKARSRGLSKNNKKSTKILDEIQTEEMGGT